MSDERKPRDNGFSAEIVSVRAVGGGNWGWPSGLVLTLRKPDGEIVEARVAVESWSKPEKPDS